MYIFASPRRHIDDVKVIYITMDKNEIKQQETANDGQSIFLFFDHMAGMYLAFGLSAYYTTMVTDPYLSYSEEMQMPVALLHRKHIHILRQSLKKLEHTEKLYYHFLLRQVVGNNGYDKWAQKMLTRYTSINGYL